MTKYILIGGYIHKSPDGGESFAKELLKGLKQKPAKILDCIFSRDRSDWNKRFKEDKRFFKKISGNFELELALPEKFLQQVKGSDVVFFQGGSPQKLMGYLGSDIDWAKEFKGKTVIGSSGGADALVKYYGVGKTGNIGEGLGFLPIKFIPHWKSDHYSLGLEIDWEYLLEELRSYREDLEIVTLGDGDFATFER